MNIFRRLFSKRDDAEDKLKACPYQGRMFPDGLTNLWNTMKCHCGATIEHIENSNSWENDEETRKHYTPGIVSSEGGTLYHPYYNEESEVNHG